MKLETIRHSYAHVLALAVKEIYPDAKFGIGPVIENGFYYDFEFKKPISSEDLPKIEQKMKELINQNLKFEKKELTIQKAINFFQKAKQSYKVELIKDLKKEGAKKVTLYQSGDLTDLCKGPHIKSTKQLNPKAFKLTHLSGAYWKGSEENPMLQRIYGTAFETEKELKDHLEKLKEIEKRDHRILGQKLELFMFDEEVGQGLPLWLPKGAYIRHKIMEFAFNTYLKNGYEPVVTPHIASEKLWQHSGHLDFYSEDMYNPFGIEEEQYRLKPMNCPLQVKMYKLRPRSYRELPLRWTEMGTVYRYERSGTLHGLTRVRGFTQDDAHVICTPEQLHQELLKTLELTFYILKTFNFKDFEINLSVRDPKNKKKYIGSDKKWQQAENDLKKAVKDMGQDNFNIDKGEAVFYGPKIDVKVSDSLNRKWQISTIQLDFNLPGKFKMNYIGKDGNEHTPFMIHRALLGSLERFMGVYIEHVAGNFPLWLAPTQIQILPISEKLKNYTQEIKKELDKNQLRSEIIDEQESLGKRIRESEIQKIPYILIIGEKEAAEKNVSVRNREKGDIGKMDLNKFIEKIKQEENKK